MVKDILYKYFGKAKNFYHTDLGWQMVHYFIAGGTCTLFDFAVYFFLTRYFNFWQAHYEWANVIALVLSATIFFIWSKKIVFKNQDKKIFWQYVKFWIMVVITTLIYQGLFVLFTRVNIYDLLAKVFCAIIVLFVRFIVNKFWVFTP